MKKKILYLTLLAFVAATFTLLVVPYLGTVGLAWLAIAVYVVILGGVIRVYTAAEQAFSTQQVVGRALVKKLSAAAPQRAGQSLVARRCSRYPVQFPLVAVVNRSGESITVRGLSLNVGGGGMSCQVDGKLEPGESVQIRIADPGLEMAARAQVCYRNGDIYGLAFGEQHVAMRLRRGRR